MSTIEEERADVAEVIADGGLVIAVGETSRDAHAWLRERVPDGLVLADGSPYAWHRPEPPRALAAYAMTVAAVERGYLAGLHQHPVVVVLLSPPGDVLRDAVLNATAHDTSRWYVSDVTT